MTPDRDTKSSEATPTPRKSTDVRDLPQQDVREPAAADVKGGIVAPCDRSTR